MEEKNLNKALTPVKLWAIIVGAVVSGMYFGWNYLFEKTNFTGALIATFIVTLFYVSFVFCYSELATAIPSAAGPTAYAEKSFGKFAGFIAGFSILLEYIFATPGIALSIGAYVHGLLPVIPANIASITAFCIFVFINIKGIESAAIVSVIVTAVAILGVAVYFILGIPTVDVHGLFSSGASMNGMHGIFAAIPFVVWFYLAVESGAMGAEECKNPQKDIPKAFISGIGALVVMAVAVLIVTAGNSATDLSAVASTDNPLPAILSKVYGENSFLVKLVGFFGLFGLAASLHGIMIGYSRQAYAMSRSGYLPKALSNLDKNGTPVFALVSTSLIGLFFVITGNVGSLVVFSCIGSSVMAVLSIASWFVLRKKQPALARPYRLKSALIPMIAAITCAVVVVALVVSQASLLFLAAIVYAAAILYYLIKDKVFANGFVSTENEMEA